MTWRERVDIEGRVRTVRVWPIAGTATVEVVVDDGTGTLAIVFLGRRHIPGIAADTRLRAQGVVGDHRGRLAILNPTYQLRDRRWTRPGGEVRWRRR